MAKLNLNLEGEGEEQVSIIMNPFQTDCVTNISINFTNSVLGNPYWYGYVKFKNGNTEGEQRTSKHQTFEEVVVEVKQILDSLNNN